MRLPVARGSQSSGPSTAFHGYAYGAATSSRPLTIGRTLLAAIATVGANAATTPSSQRCQLATRHFVGKAPDAAQGFWLRICFQSFGASSLHPDKALTAIEFMPGRESDTHCLAAPEVPVCSFSGLWNRSTAVCARAALTTSPVSLSDINRSCRRARTPVFSAVGHHVLTSGRCE